MSVPHDSTAAGSKLSDFSTQLTQRVIVENVSPAIEGSPYAVKRVLGDDVDIEADLVCDGHEIVQGRVLFRALSDSGAESSWRSAPRAAR